MLYKSKPTKDRKVAEVSLETVSVARVTRCTDNLLLRRWVTNLNGMELCPSGPVAVTRTVPSPWASLYYCTEFLSGSGCMPTSGATEKENKVNLSSK